MPAGSPQRRTQPKSRLIAKRWSQCCSLGRRVEGRCAPLLPLPRRLGRAVKLTSEIGFPVMAEHDEAVAFYDRYWSERVEGWQLGAQLGMGMLESYSATR